MALEFESWGKTPRWTNEVMTITEKIDGTNACVVILPFERRYYESIERGEAILVRDPVREDDVVFATQSRKKFIWPGKQSDNAGFAAWAWENAVDIVGDLGYGKHYGEWWGRGIQRGYEQDTKRFSLFNPWRYSEDGDRLFTVKEMGTVPILYSGAASDEAVQSSLFNLEMEGSVAAPGYMNAEGVIVSYKLAQRSYKAFVNDDGIPKSLKEGN